MPPPDRDPAAIVAAYAALAAPGACCPHALGAHRTDGTCSLVGVRACNCPGWRPLEVLDPAPPASPTRFVVGVEDTDALPCSTLTDTGGPCGHRADQHRHDPAADSGLGACGVESCGCINWSYVIPDDDNVIDAEIESSGDPLTDAIHDVLARYYPADVEGRWVACRDELIDAARGWAASALGMQVDPS